MGISTLHQATSKDLRSNLRLRVQCGLRLGPPTRVVLFFRQRELGGLMESRTCRRGVKKRPTPEAAPMQHSLSSTSQQHPAALHDDLSCTCYIYASLTIGLCSLRDQNPGSALSCTCCFALDSFLCKPCTYEAVTARIPFAIRCVAREGATLSNLLLPFTAH